MRLINGFMYVILNFTPLLWGMDDDRSNAFDIHREKYQGVLYAIQAARRAMVGLHVEEVCGLFGNALSVPVDLYYGDNFYKTVLSRTEVPLYSSQMFTVRVPEYSKMIQISSQKYFYAYIYLAKNNAPHVLTVEELQNLKFNTTPFDIDTNEQHTFDEETRAMYKQKFERIRAFNQ